MKALFPSLEICINGGITSLDQAVLHLEAGVDGVMIGRTAYHEPAKILVDADQHILVWVNLLRPSRPYWICCPTSKMS